MGSDEIRFNPRFVETDAIAIAERDAGRTLKPSEVSKWWQRHTVDVMADAPGRAAGFFAKKAVFFLGPAEAPSSYHYEMQREETILLRGIPLGFWLLGPLALAGAILVVIRRREALPLALLFVAYAIGLAIFFPLAHYRAPVLPAVFPLAALALGALSGNRGRALVLPIVLVVVSATLANLARPGYEDEKVTWWYNRGVMLLNRGEIDAAEQSFLAGRDVDDTSRLPDLGLAAVARERRDLAGEAAHLDRALAKMPGNPATLGYIGQNRFRRGQREEGLATVRRAVEKDPRDPNLRRIFGAVLMEAGRIPQALSELEAEERLAHANPDNLSRRVWCLSRLRRPRDALALADRGTKMFPGFPPLHFERAYALLALNAPREQVAAAVRAGRDAGGRIPPDLANFAR
jgi:tetratricopeptide (TPR) repeat protein